MKILLTSLISNMCFLTLIGQSGVIKGTVTDATNNETIPFANVFIEQTKSGVATDFDGNYNIGNLKPVYNITYSFVGYNTQICCRSNSKSQ